MKIVKFLRNDLIRGNVVYCCGEIAGFDDAVADRLCAERSGGPFAVLHNDGRPKQAGGKIPGAKDFMTPVELEEHVEGLKKAGKWPAHLDKPVELGAPKITPLGQYN